jgi:predicted Zn-dependent peptidase
LKRVLVAIPAPPVGSTELAHMQLVDRILSEGKLSRLYLRMVEDEQMASLATTELEETTDPYHLLVRLELEKGVQPDMAIRSLFEELETLCKTTPDEAELRKAKNQCISHILNDLETTFDQGFQLGLWETLFRWDGLNKYIEDLEAATTAQIQETAEKYCDPNKALVCLTAPD